MKKILWIGIFILIGIFFFGARHDLIIPEEAIRFRVIANSDSEEDQRIKELVSYEVQKQISIKLKGTYNVDDARQILKNNMPVFQETVRQTLRDHGIDTSFTLHYGMNPFPQKVYKGVTYKSGNYESLVVTLGDGMGKNWWCVLFPPLCLLEAEESSDSSEVEYKFFLKELFDKYF